jgi:hypothetical protein
MERRQSCIRVLIVRNQRLRGGDGHSTSHHRQLALMDFFAIGFMAYRGKSKTRSAPKDRASLQFQNILQA